MSQNLINDLSDRVSALTARVSAAEATAESNRQMAEALTAEVPGLIREGRRMAEWLGAIKNEINARGECASLDNILGYATAALEGDDPHWMTDEYLTKAQDPRRYLRS